MCYIKYYFMFSEIQTAMFSSIYSISSSKLRHHKSFYLSFYFRHHLFTLFNNMMNYCGTHLFWYLQYQKCIYWKRIIVHFSTCIILTSVFFIHSVNSQSNSKIFSAVLDIKYRSTAFYGFFLKSDIHLKHCDSWWLF